MFCNRDKQLWVDPQKGNSIPWVENEITKMHRGDNAGYSVTLVLEERLPTVANFYRYLAGTVLQYVSFWHLAPKCNCVHTDCSIANDSKDQKSNRYHLNVGWNHPRNMTFQWLLCVCMVAVVPDTVIIIMSEFSTHIHFFDQHCQQAVYS